MVTEYIERLYDITTTASHYPYFLFKYESSRAKFKPTEQPNLLDLSLGTSIILINQSHIFLPVLLVLFMDIYHTIVDCPMGRLLVAATDEGICSVKLGNSDSTLEENLQEEFTSAIHQQGRRHLTVWTAEILSYLDGEKTGLDLPLDIQATSFQQQVWQALRTIPYGETRTYQQVAQKIGKGSASRAVGKACGANPVALVIPCHRVLRKDGGLGGYSWGLDRKQSLLDMERTID